MSYIVALLTAFTAFYLAIHELHQSFGNYFDYVGLLVVAIGTFSVGISIFPWRDFNSFVNFIFQSFGKYEVSKKLFVNKCIQVVSEAKSGNWIQTNFDKNSFYQKLLDDGIELIQLGISCDMIETILTERAIQEVEKNKTFIHGLRSLSKYPPAFGLIGTVLGLVSLMRAIAGGAGGEEVGIRMSVALVATLYGLILANLIINPLAEYLTKKLSEIEKLNEIAISTIILAANAEASTLESQELLKAFSPNSNDTATQAEAS